jgi:hypothetical protein
VSANGVRAIAKNRREKRRSARDIFNAKEGKRISRVIRAIPLNEAEGRGRRQRQHVTRAQEVGVGEQRHGSDGSVHVHYDGGDAGLGVALHGAQHHDFKPAAALFSLLQQLRNGGERQQLVLPMRLRRGNEILDRTLHLHKATGCDFALAAHRLKHAPAEGSQLGGVTRGSEKGGVDGFSAPKLLNGGSISASE